MELVRERTETYSVEESEKAAHNAQIKERYRMLQDAETSQFNTATPTQTYTKNESVQTKATTYYAPTFDTVSTVEQHPQITEYVRGDMRLFTTDKLDRVMEQMQQTAYVAPTAVVEPTFIADVTKQSEESAVVNTEYSFTSFAKMMLAAFAVVVIALLAWICVNTNAIQQKTVQLEQLETQKAELIERHAEIQRRIDNAQSEETIRRYAESKGLLGTD